MNTQKLRSIAIIAHVDHGKTTLVDELLKQSGTLNTRTQLDDRVMDSNDLEKERGITILAKNTAINWKGYRINIVDTPGHADFGGEVERILSMVDSVLLLVDSVEGPMPQTRFVTQKAFAQNLKPIVVVNKIDKEGARPDWVVDQVFDLFDNLGATDEQLDFPVIYTSAINGTASFNLDEKPQNINKLLDAIIELVPPPAVDIEGPFQMQISSIDYSTYVGVIGIGRVTRGSIKPNTPITVINAEGKKRNGKILQILGYLGLDRKPVDSASAGDIIAITGIDNLKISDTICDVNHPEQLPPLAVDEPTVSMTFQVNDSPFAGKSGKYLTSRQIRDRLSRELIHNVALRVEDLEDPDKFKVSGRGELHLSILIENMRREGYEIAVSRPQVIFKEIDGKICEPFENVSIDIEEQHQGTIMEKIAQRGGDIKNIEIDGKGRVRLEFVVPSRGLIGFHPEFVTITSGTGLFYHSFDHYGEKKSTSMTHRNNGVMIANQSGKARAYAIWNLQNRGALFIAPQTEVYEGMVVGLHSRDNDIVVNVCKEKQLTNMRASGSDENIILTPPRKFTLEQALTFIDDDELVEITPDEIRMRKKFLKEHERKKHSREEK